MSFARGSSEDSKKRFLGSPAPLFRDARRDRAALSSRAHASLAPIFRPNGAMRAVSRATTLWVHACAALELPDHLNLHRSVVGNVGNGDRIDALHVADLLVGL